LSPVAIQQPPSSRCSTVPPAALCPKPINGATGPKTELRVKIELVDIEPLTIQIRLVVASVDKAKEMGMDWWTTSPFLSSKAQGTEREREVEELRKRIGQLEAREPLLNAQSPARIPP